MPVKPHEAEVIRLPKGVIYVGKKPEKTVQPHTPETAAPAPAEPVGFMETPESEGKSKMQLLADEVREMRKLVTQGLDDNEPFLTQRANELAEVIVDVAEVGIYFDPVSESDLQQLSEAIAYEDDFHDPHWYEIRGSGPYRTLACIDIDAEYHVHYFKVAPRRWFPQFWKITWQVWYYAKDAIDCETSDHLRRHIVQKYLK